MNGHPVVPVAPDIQALMDSTQVEFPVQTAAGEIILRAPTLEDVAKHVVPHLSDAPGGGRKGKGKKRSRETVGSLWYRSRAVQVGVLMACLPGLPSDVAGALANKTGGESDNPLFDAAWELCGLPPRPEFGDGGAGEVDSGDGEEAPAPVRPSR